MTDHLDNTTDNVVQAVQANSNVLWFTGRRVEGEDTVVRRCRALEAGEISVLDLIQWEIDADVYYKQNYMNDGQRFVAWYLRRVWLYSPMEAKQAIIEEG